MLFTADGLGGFPVELLREQALFSTSLKAALVQTLGLVILMIVIQFSYLFSRLVSRRRGLMMILVGLVSSWFVFRVGGWIAPLLDWIPPVKLHGIQIDAGVVYMHTAYLGVAPIIGSFAAALLLFIIGSNVLERDIEL